MQIIHSLLWGVATPGKLGSSSSQAFMFFHFRTSPFCFLLTVFHDTFSISCKILTILCLLILSPQGTVDGLQVQISQEIHPLLLGVATPGEDRPELQFRPLGLHFFVPALLLSMLAPDENPARYGKHTDALVNLNTKLNCSINRTNMLLNVRMNIPIEHLSYSSGISMFYCNKATYHHANTIMMLTHLESVIRFPSEN